MGPLHRKSPHLNLVPPPSKTPFSSKNTPPLAVGTQERGKKGVCVEGGVTVGEPACVASGLGVTDSCKKTPPPTTSSKNTPPQSRAPLPTTTTATTASSRPSSTASRPASGSLARKGGGAAECNSVGAGAEEWAVWGLEVEEKGVGVMIGGRQKVSLVVAQASLN
jgi:hypothetical protein